MDPPNVTCTNSTFSVNHKLNYPLNWPISLLFIDVFVINDLLLINILIPYLVVHVGHGWSFFLSAGLFLCTPRWQWLILCVNWMYLLIDLFFRNEINHQILVMHRWALRSSKCTCTHKSFTCHPPACIPFSDVETCTHKSTSPCRLCYLLNYVE